MEGILPSALEKAVDNSGRRRHDDALATGYVYELRIGGEIVSTGRLAAEDALQAGDVMTIAGTVAQVEELAWANGEPRLLLRRVVELNP